MENHIKTIIFDLDETLTEDVSWYYLTEKLGASVEKHKNLYRDVLTQAISESDAVTALLHEWQSTNNATKDNIKSIFNEIKFRKNALEIVNYLRPKYNIVLLSGSIGLFVELIAEKLKIDGFLFSSRLEFDEKGYLSGFVYKVDQASKKYHQFLDFLADNSLSRENTAVVGNAENDLPLFETAGLSFILKTGKNDELLETADHVIEDLLELKRYL